MRVSITTGWISGRIPHDLLETLKPVHEGNSLNPTDHGIIHLFNKNKWTWKEKYQGQAMTGSNQHSLTAFGDDLRILTDHQLSSALNQCSTGGKSFPLQHSHSMCGGQFGPAVQILV